MYIYIALSRWGTVTHPGWAQEGPAFQPLKNMLNS